MTGPESCGKTELSVLLAEGLGVRLLPELCREYLNRLDRPYRHDDVLQMATDQHDQYLLAANDIVPFVADTESLVMRIWYREKYERESPDIMKMWTREQFDLYLLCMPDLPWVDDPLRENPHDRERLFDLYQAELQGAGRRYAVVSGLGDNRLQCALAAIRNAR